MGYWAQSVVAGVNKLVLGYHDSVHIRESMKRQLMKFLSYIKICFKLEYRLLNWIRLHLKDSKLVKKISWAGFGTQVKCSETDEHGRDFMTMIPDWFINSDI